MGNACPSGFERGPVFTCHATCPGKFKYNSETEEEKCVYAMDNRYSFLLQSLPAPPMEDEVPPMYGEELARVKKEAKRVEEQILAEAPMNEKLSAYKDIQRDTVQRHSTLQSQYASYASIKEAGDAIAQVTASIKPMRPPTAPAEDIHKERSAILRGSAPNFLLFQIALVILLICLLVYAFVPAEYAHGIAFVLLSVGIAVGIFLTK
jgi:hypothetical protein